MRGMILAAGLGERMLPLTLQRAKPALPLFNKPFIVHCIEYLKRFGIDEIAINLHHLPDSITAIVQDGFDLGAKIHYSYEHSLLGTGGGIKKIEDFLSPETFILMNSDFISDIDLNKVIEYHKAQGAISTIVVMRSKSDEYPKLVIDEEVNVRIIGDERGNCMFCGMHVIEPEIFDHVPEGQNLDIKDTYRKIIRQGGRIQAYEHTGYWYELGNLKKYLHGHEQLVDMGPEFINQILNIRQSGKLSRSKNRRMSTNGDDAQSFSFCAQETFIDKEACLSGIVVVDNGCRIEKGASVKDSVLHSNSIISEGASISECIIGGSVVIPAAKKLTMSAVSLLPSKELMISSDKGLIKEGNMLIKKFLR